MKTTIYSLRTDQKKIQKMQKVSLESEEYGYQQTHGLFGSNEWWNHIADGTLPIQTARGQISKVYKLNVRDWPEFQMRLDDGTEITWTREADSSELDELYIEGAAIEIDYVIQLLKPKAWNGAAETKCIVEIRVTPQ